jgi:8-oxo-dGTP pyrophosphatase MutT (NUDIX family)
VEPGRQPAAQYAALPWRRNAGGEIEILLITSRESRRWVIPKGWPIKGMKSPQAAAREAFEEAGVSGQVEKLPVGSYAYDKRLKDGGLQHVRVAVYPLLVEQEADVFPEAAQREKHWISPLKAASLVVEPELILLLATFRP